jgi:hypothetical protein
VAFRNMMPDELPIAVVEATEVWLGDAYDNIILAQDLMAARGKEEEEQLATLGGYPEPPMERRRQKRHGACGS